MKIAKSTHFHTCPKLQGGERIHRHDKIKLLLKKHIDQIPLVSQLEPKSSEYIAMSSNNNDDDYADDDVEDNRHADLVVFSPTATHCIDVTIIQPDAASYVSQSSQKSLSAATLIENKK